MNEKQVIERVKRILTRTEEGSATEEDLNRSINDALSIIGHYERKREAFYPEKNKDYSGQAIRNIARFDGSIFLGWGLRIRLNNEANYIAFVPRKWDPDAKEWEGIDHYACNRLVALSDIESLKVVKGGR